MSGKEVLLERFGNGDPTVSHRFNVMDGGKGFVKEEEVPEFLALVKRTGCAAVQTWDKDLNRFAIDVDLGCPEEYQCFDAGAFADTVRMVMIECAAREFGSENVRPDVYVRRSWDPVVNDRKMGYHFVVPNYALSMPACKLLALTIRERTGLYREELPANQQIVDLSIYAHGKGLRCTWALKFERATGTFNRRAVPYGALINGIWENWDESKNWDMELSTWATPHTPHLPVEGEEQAALEAARRKRPAAAQLMPEIATAAEALTRVQEQTVQRYIERTWNRKCRTPKLGPEGQSVIAEIDDTWCLACATPHQENSRACYIVIHRMTAVAKCHSGQSRTVARALPLELRELLWGRDVLPGDAEELLSLSNVVDGLPLYMALRYGDTHRVVGTKNLTLYVMHWNTCIWSRQPFEKAVTLLHDTVSGEITDEVRRAALRMCTCEQIELARTKGRKPSTDNLPAGHKEPACEGVAMYKAVTKKLAGIGPRIREILTVAFHGEAKFDAGTDCLPFACGTMVIATDKGPYFRRIRPDDFVSKAVPRPYNPSARPSALFERTLATCLPEGPKRRFFVRALGKTFCGDTTDQKFFQWYGSTASNGKSVIGDVLAAAFGDLVAVLSSDALSAGSASGSGHGATTAWNRLPGALMVIVPDMANLPVHATMLKVVTHGDNNFSFRRLFCEEEDTCLRATLHALSNHRMKCDASDIGLFRGLWSVPFGVKFVDLAELNARRRMQRTCSGALEGQTTLDEFAEYTEGDLEDMGMALRDPTLKERLVKPDELDCVVASVIEAMCTFRAQGLAPVPEEIVGDSLRAQYAQSKVCTWALQALVTEAGSCVPLADAYKAFTTWCRDVEGLQRSPNRTVFVQELTTIMGYTLDTGGDSLFNVVIHEKFKPSALQWHTHNQDF